MGQHDGALDAPPAGPHHPPLTSISTSAASWRHMTSVPTRAMLFTYEKVMREIVATWWRNMTRKSCREGK